LAARLNHDSRSIDARAEEDELRERILKSLHFPEMNERKSTVALETPSTLEWIFGGSNPQSFDSSDDERSDNNSTRAADGSIDQDLDHEERSDEVGDSYDHPDERSYFPKAPKLDTSSHKDEALEPSFTEDHGDNFKTWLISDQLIYWISGKPGSGKSTLVKFLLSDSRTLVGLEKWHKDVIVLSHFFWKPGSPMQQSFKGLICSIAYQLLSQETNLLRYFNDTTTTFRKSSPSDWDQSQLCKLLYTYRDQPSRPVCIFIDALDESRPGQDTLDTLRFIKSMVSPKIKICVSSRPEPLFTRHFSKYPYLEMHELTKLDIFEYSKTTLRDSTLLESQTLRVSELAWQVAESAEGIFLWAVLVTQSLIRGLNNGDAEQEIERRLNDMPKDLMSLYRDILRRSAEDLRIYRKYVSMAINLKHIASTRKNPFSLLTSFECMMVMEPDLLESYAIQGGRVSRKRLEEKTEVMRNHLNSGCPGILEVTLWNDAIHFTHRSAEEFIFDTKEGRRLWQPCDTPDEELLCRSFKAILAINRFIPRWDSEDFLEMLYEWNQSHGISSKIQDVFLKLTLRSYEKGFISPPTMNKYSELDPEDLVGQFFLSSFRFGHRLFTVRNLETLEPYVAHDTICGILNTLCDISLTSGRLGLIGAPEYIFERGYGPNWAMHTTNTNRPIGSLWFKVLISTLKWMMRWWPHVQDKSSLGPAATSIFQTFRQAGARISATFPVYFETEAPQDSIGSFFRPADALAPRSGHRLLGRARFMILEIDAVTLMDFIMSWAHQDPIITESPNYPGPAIYMKVLAFGTPTSRHLYIVESESVSARLVEAAEAALIFRQPRSISPEDSLKEILDRCDRDMAELRSYCRQTKKDYFWNRFRIWSPPV
jgi:hypothetical protein